MEEKNAIEVRDITKAFKVYPDRSNNIKDYMIHGRRRRYEIRNVINGLTFSVRRGEAVGLIGHNGCGKSTTLKMLTRIMYPDSGSITMSGRVSSMIELGAGFHPDMSGRENIYINASIFGLKRHEIDERLEDIIEFSELRTFIDNPVRTYSSGMYMRLAFSIAINVNADILLIDEILAVGDAAFQQKCFKRLKEIKAQGTTIIIVSHSMPQIEQICDRTIWLHEGVVKAEGEPRVVDALYTEYMMGDDADDAAGAISSEAEECAAILKGVMPDGDEWTVSQDAVVGRLETYFGTPASDKCDVTVETEKDAYSAAELLSVAKDGSKRPSIMVHIKNLGDEVLTSHRRNPIYLTYHVFDADGRLLENDGKRTIIDGYVATGDEADIAMEIGRDDLKYLCAGNKLVITLVAEYLFWLDANGGNYKTVELI